MQTIWLTSNASEVFWVDDNLIRGRSTGIVPALIAMIMCSLFLLLVGIHSDLLAPMPAANQMLMEKFLRRVPFEPIFEDQIECDFDPIDQNAVAL
jgi:hypothetical protein